MSDIETLVKRYHDELITSLGTARACRLTCDEANAIRKILTEERERCAVIAETLRSPLVGSDTGITLIPSPREIADAIRKGGAK